MRSAVYDDTPKNSHCEIRYTIGEELIALAMYSYDRSGSNLTKCVWIDLDPQSL